MTDIITVVFREELPILKLQAKSIALYCQDIDLGKIIVVVNDDGLDVSEIDRSWWGKFSDQVVLVHRSTWNIEYVENGWLTQQLLKLLATGIATGKWSIVLDTKTIFVRPVNPLAGKPIVGKLRIAPVFRESQQRVNNLFKVNMDQQLGPAGVPYIFNNQLAQEMLTEVEQLTDKSFAEWFQGQGMITEFILYSGYVLYKFGSLELLYDVGQPPAIEACNLCHNDVSMFDRKFRFMKSAGTVSIHRGAWRQLSQTQQNQYIDFLASRGIE